MNTASKAYFVHLAQMTERYCEFSCRPEAGWAFRLHVVRATGAAYVKTRTGKHASARVSAKRMPELCAAVSEFISTKGYGAECALPRAAIASTGSTT